MHHYYYGGKMRVRELSKRIQLLEPMDANAIHISKDHYFKNSYIIDLPLDATPDHAWQDIFEHEWKTSQDWWDRKIYIMGNRLRLIATTDQLEEKLAWVKQVMNRVNQEIDAYNRTVPIVKQLKQQPFKEDKTTTEMMREMLRKGFPSATR